MPTRRVRIFLASPADVAAERHAAGDVIDDLNHTLGQTSDLYAELVRWETHAWPGWGRDAQDVINGELAAPYDVFIGIMWARLGTSTLRAPSGTVEEFQQAYHRWLLHKVPYLMFYFCQRPVRPQNHAAEEQLRLVRDFQQWLSHLGGFHWEYSDVQDFQRALYRHLYKHLTESAPREVSRFHWRAELKHAERYRRVLILKHPEALFELDFKYRIGTLATVKVNGVTAGRQVTFSGADAGCAFAVTLPDGHVVPGRITYTIFLPLGTFPTLFVSLDDQCVYSEDNQLTKLQLTKRLLANRLIGRQSTHEPSEES